MGRTSSARLVMCAMCIYGVLFVTTNISNLPNETKEIFRLEKLSLSDGEKTLIVRYTDRRLRVKEVCEAWGAYSSKKKFLNMNAHSLTTENKRNLHTEAIIKDRRDLSQAELMRIWQLGKRSSFHQIFVDKYHGLSWCKVPKAASTSWLHAFLQLAGVYDYSVTDMAGKHALLRNKYPLLPTSLLKKILPTTMKFMVVRNPFERLLSAYRDKLESFDRDLKDRGGYYYAIYGKKIVKSYRKSSGTEEVNEVNTTDRKEPTFREFVQYLLDTDVERYDEHWKPIFLLCTPCHVKFDIIAKMETLNEDAKFVLRQRRINNKVQMDWSHKTDNHQKTSDVAIDYFSQLTPSEVKFLYHKYILDFLMFEYDPEPYFKIAEEASILTETEKTDEHEKFDLDDENEELEYDYDEDNKKKLNINYDEEEEE